MPNYTHTRIRIDYLARLKLLSKSHKRSSAKELEVMIERAEEAGNKDTAGKLDGPAS